MLALLVFLSGCGGRFSNNQPKASPATVPAGAILAADIFHAPVGTQWDMQNDLGDVTHFSIEAAPENDACETGNHIAMHITKTMARTWWGVGFAGAEDHFNLSIDADGSYRGIADINQNVNGLDFMTINWRPVPGDASPYMIVPPYFVRGTTQTTPTFYHGYMLRHVNTNDCTMGDEDIGLIDWKSSFYESTVSTPIYSGWAMVSEQTENCANPAVFCGAHERWYFAPGIGLVMIDADIMTIKRIN